MTVLKYMAQQLLKNLLYKYPAVLPCLLVKTTDRKYQVCEWNTLRVEICGTKPIYQNLGYMHLNPEKTGVYMYARTTIGHLHCFTKQA